MLNSVDTIKCLDGFYGSCLKFWNKEITEELLKEGFTPKKLAIKDVEKIKHDPYSPSGKLLDADIKGEWLKYYN